MTNVRYVGRHEPLDRDLLVSVLTDPAAWSPGGTEIRRPFVAFLALEAEDATDDVLGAFVTALMTAGCRYICAWGPDCERVHDAADSAFVALHPDQSTWGEEFVQTTWHADETLADALYFAIIDAHIEGRDAASVLAIASPTYAEQIERRMVGSEGLIRDVLDAD